MAILRAVKAISSLPDPLTPDTIYAVRVGAGFDLYVSDLTGATAHKVNGGDGGSPVTVLSDSVSLTYYVGKAPLGTAESASLWTIKRTIFDSSGEIASTDAATDVAWDDRLTATYA